MDLLNNDDGGLTVQCDNCGQDFNISLSGTVFDIDGLQYYVRWFICPFCGKLYIVYVDDDKTAMLKKEIKKYEYIIRVANDVKDEEKRNVFLRLYNARKDCLLMRSDRLREYFYKVLTPYKGQNGEILLAYHES